ncbi:MAG: AAA family ATPase, partial [Anaerolineales bacterium]
MKQITVRNLGQLAQADITFGDMTVFVGPQASGKSIFLQLIKLSLDFQNISQTLKKHGFHWQNSKDFLHLYFGEGMREIWNDKTFIQVDNQELNLEKLLAQRKNKKPESLFLIPAHRVMTLMTGWPRPFTNYETGDPYVVKQFSENIRQLMDAGLGSGEGPIFPQVGKMNKSIRDAIDNSVFWGA